MRKGTHENITVCQTHFYVPFASTKADQNTGGALFFFPVRTAMDGKSRVSSAIKYDFFLVGRLWELYN